VHLNSCINQSVAICVALSIDRSAVATMISLFQRDINYSALTRSRRAQRPHGQTMGISCRTSSTTRKAHFLMCNFDLQCRVCLLIFTHRLRPHKPFACNRRYMQLLQKVILTKTDFENQVSLPLTASSIVTNGCSGSGVYILLFTK
jgi:hypothetical protein